MYRIVSAHNQYETLRILERSIIEYEHRFPTMLGYVGQVNRANKKFWLVNHTNLFFVRNGYGYNSYRRFEGVIRESYNQGVVEGEFKLRPYTKIMIGCHGVFMIAINIFALYVGMDYFEMIKLILVSIASWLIPFIVVYRQIKETEKVEEEIIDFLESILNKSEKIV